MNYKTKANPEISIILATYNNEDTIQETIKSILNQTEEDFELIIINDGSTDKTKEKILKIKDKRIKLIDLKRNKGGANARNKGIQVCKGKYIAMIDADDKAYPERLEKQKEYLKRNNLDLISSKAITKEGKVLGKEMTDTEIKVSSYFGQPMVHPTWFGKREVFKTNKYNLNYKRCQDFELLTRIKNKYSLGVVNEILLFYGGNPIKKESEKYYLKIIKQNKINYLNFFRNYGFKGLFYLERIYFVKTLKGVLNEL